MGWIESRSNYDVKQLRRKKQEVIKNYSGEKSWISEQVRTRGKEPLDNSLHEREDEIRGGDR